MIVVVSAATRLSTIYWCSTWLWYRGCEVCDLHYFHTNQTVQWALVPRGWWNCHPRKEFSCQDDLLWHKGDLQNNLLLQWLFPHRSLHCRGQGFRFFFQNCMYAELSALLCFIQACLSSDPPPHTHKERKWCFKILLFSASVKIYE